jgi:hypothetical protein
MNPIVGKNTSLPTIIKGNKLPIKQRSMIIYSRRVYLINGSGVWTVGGYPRIAVATVNY